MQALLRIMTCYKYPAAKAYGSELGLTVDGYVDLKKSEVNISWHGGSGLQHKFV